MLVALALVMQTPVPVATPEDEIVVLRRKLRSAKFRYSLRDRRLRTCRATMKDVDPVVATAGCEAIGWCVEQDRAGRSAIGGCIAERRPAIVERITALRAGR